jgi:hypothetical protein
MKREEEEEEEEDVGGRRLSARRVGMEWGRGDTWCVFQDVLVGGRLSSIRAAKTKMI